MKGFNGFEFCLFGLVGVLNTLLDYCTFNLLTRKSVRMAAIPANVLSTSVGMIFSFMMNSLVVFDSSRSTMIWTLGSFVAINAISMYIIQNGILGLALHVWPQPAQWVARIAALPLFGIKLDREFLVRNICKFAATCGSFIFNYYSYKLFVFA